MSYHVGPDARKENVSSRSDDAEEQKEHEIEEEKTECKPSHHWRIVCIREVVEKYGD